MNNQLQLLIQLSDLDTQLEELKNERIRGKEESLGFKVQAKEAEIKKFRDTLRKKIGSDLLNQYDRIIKRYKIRAVAQVNDGVCYGCFMALPTSYVSEADRNNKIITCPNCGRILFWIE
ncbi:MAG: C4-type zinc ribbon domain-containing protein [bacterium]|nr:C4-type zinc ribbon domain-containing protein [bacterium]